MLGSSHTHLGAAFSGSSQTKGPRELGQATQQGHNNLPSTLPFPAVPPAGDQPQTAASCLRIGGLGGGVVKSSHPQVTLRIKEVPWTSTYHQPKRPAQVMWAAPH